NEHLSEIKGLPLNPEAQKLVARYEELFVQWEEARNRVLELSRAGDKDGARKATEEASYLRDRTIFLVIALQNISHFQAEDRYGASQELFNSSVQNFMIILAVAGTIGVL